mgnify:CR=1 FL=1
MKSGSAGMPRPPSALVCRLPPDKIDKIFSTSSDALAGDQDQKTGAKKVRKSLKKSKKDKDLVAYVQFRQLMADYGLSMQTASTEQFVKIHAAWLKNLEQYVDDYPESPDAAEAMLEGAERDYDQERAAQIRHGDISQLQRRIEAAELLKIGNAA